MRKIVLGLLAALAAIPTPVVAKDNAGVMQFKAAPAVLRSDAAYLLIRTSTAKSGMFPIQHVLTRIPSSQELDQYRASKRAAYEKALPALTKKAKGRPVPGFDEFAFDYPGTANAFVVKSGDFLEDGTMRTVLVEVPVGTYVLYGITLGNRGLVTCNCLGTVRFAAHAGVITDVGSLFADKVHKPSPVPHLEDNLGEQMFQYGLIFGQALVPQDGSTPVPAALQSFKIEPASFEVTSQYYENGAGSINRLAPIPGILSYERGRPFDVKKGKLAE